MRPLLLTVLALGLFGVVAPARAAGDPAAGKAKASSCGMCHGPTGEGTSMAPKLAGLNQATFVQAMNDYKSGKKDNAMMKSQAASLSDADIANLAAYYATLK
jgi:cytochrome c553